MKEELGMYIQRCIFSDINDKTRMTHVQLISMDQKKLSRNNPFLSPMH